MGEELGNYGKSSVSCTYRLGFLYWYPSDITQYLTFVSGYFLIRLILFDTDIEIFHVRYCLILRIKNGAQITAVSKPATVSKTSHFWYRHSGYRWYRWYSLMIRHCWYNMIHLWYITIRIWYNWYSISQWTWGAFVIRHGMLCDTLRYHMIRCMISPLE